MAVDADALDRAEPPLLARAGDQLERAARRLGEAAAELHALRSRTAAGWSGAGHGAWDRKVRDLAGRTETAADVLGELGAAVTTVARAAAAGQEQLRTIAAAAAAQFPHRLSTTDDEWAVARARYAGTLSDAVTTFDDVADQAPPAPTVPVICPPPPPPPERPWWDDVLFGSMPVVLDEQCQPIEFLEGGAVPRSMLRWVRSIGRADKLDEPIELLRHRIVASEGFAHTSKHAERWFGRVPNKAMLEEWADILADASRSTQVFNTAVGTGQGRVQVLAQLYTKGDKHLILYHHLHGKLKGELVTAVVAKQWQLSEAYRLLKATQ